MPVAAICPIPLPRVWPRAHSSDVYYLQSTPSPGIVHRTSPSGIVRRRRPCSSAPYPLALCPRYCRVEGRVGTGRHDWRQRPDLLQALDVSDHGDDTIAATVRLPTRWASWSRRASRPRAEIAADGTPSWWARGITDWPARPTWQDRARTSWCWKPASAWAGRAPSTRSGPASGSRPAPISSACSIPW